MLSAIAADTAQAVKEAAKGMPLDDVHVTVRRTSPTQFTRSVELVGELSPTQREALLAAAGSGSVETMLRSSVATEEA